jgi:4-amino-4-deoxy-L-arabinose transferase-like glycosyltransferase
LRFWNLGSASLHGDEDIMALAARGVLEHGEPILPSGMVYVRAPLHTYLIAASMTMFGDNEWAIRFPSALVGSFVGLLGFWMGRRFLDPVPNVAFAAILTFLPGIIDYSLTGRMYVFFIASLLVFGAALFGWERRQRVLSLVLAFLAWILALQFHTLSVFAAPLFLFPGLSVRSPRLLAQGAAGAVAAVATYGVVEVLIDHFYPAMTERPPLVLDPAQHPLQILFRNHAALVVGAVTLGFLAFGVIAVVGRRPRSRISLVFALAIASGALLHHHVGMLLLLVGAIAWFRFDAGSRWVPLGVFALAVAIFGVQFTILQYTGDLPLRRIAGALVGRPGFWPTLKLADFTPSGAALYVGVLAVACVRLARGRAIPIHFLLFAIGAWTPILVIGFFRWDVPSRYLAGALPFFLLCLVAGISYVLGTFRFGPSFRARPRVGVLLWLTLVLVVVNPVKSLHIARNDYPVHPDHKGAAEFVRSLQPAPDAILIAEDSINQTYYLGRVDYRLQHEAQAAGHAVLVDGVMRGQYTGTPILGTGKALTDVLDAAGDRELYILGSGENFADGRSAMRGGGIREVLESNRLEVVYEGRDGRTKVWRLRR